MLKILQARLQQYVNHELPDVQAGFRKGRGTRDHTVNIRWIKEKAREFQRNIYFCFIDYGNIVKAVYCHSAYLTYMQSITCEMPGWKKHKLESNLLGEISIASDMQMTPPLWLKAKGTEEPLGESERVE